MKPYYSKYGVVIIHAKADDVVLARDFFGVLVLDPPFTFKVEKLHEVIQPFARYLTMDCVILVLPMKNISTATAFGHPHVRDLAQVRDLLRETSGAILDPYMGTGTTLVAAKQLGRHAVGIEIEEKFCAAAARRLDA